MLTKILAAASLLIALGTIAASYSQRSALTLRQATPPTYWPRYGTTLSGQYRGNTWVSLPNRSAYGSFRGGGPSAGK
ncbi:hypothetical protein AVDCRST_MAG81-1123 [uncultured Synechococcales cyanobacterium]|uniref:Uncharacterized protein n=1 Tax=uncultured Synechococcales cyanobacterium TaxID=1936017 RepID=A0A6J4V2Z8_9CYAN|nr:hypothetical protein AVDCRST_MAG81-1123 [uncultured Synechococcales cyanobacterium]